MDPHWLRRGLIAAAVGGLALAACASPGALAASPSPLALTIAPATSTQVPSATAVPVTSTPPVTAEATLVPPISNEPAAGICATAEGEWATAEILPDAPSPRCLKVTGQQRLKVVNRTNAAVRAQLGPFSVEVQSGEEGVLDRPFGAFLAPGVHQVIVTPGSGPEVWLQ